MEEALSSQEDIQKLPLTRPSSLENKTAQRKALIHQQLDEIRKRKIVYQYNMWKLKKIDDITNVICITCGVTSTTSLFMNLAGTSETSIIVGASLTAIATILNAIKTVYRVTDKYETCRTTFHQLSELERDVRIAMLRNHLDATSQHQLLEDIAHRLSLIEDSSTPLHPANTQQ